MPDQIITKPSSNPIAIVGGGAIGLAIGWRLAQRGASVAIYERGEAGHGASWAAAGMLAAGVETEPGEAALAVLNRRSLALWPEFASELEQVSGLSVDLRREGTLMVALTRDDSAQLRFTYDFQREHGIALEWLSARQALEREPRLNPSLAAAVYSPGDHQADNRMLVRALKRAFLAAGGALHEHAPVIAIDVAAGRVTGLRVGEARVAAETVVLAAGAWSGEIGGLPAEARVPVRPVKGQMIALKMDPAAPLLRHVVWAPRAYMVPRRDGRLIVGGTVEEKGFDTALTAGGVFAMLEGAWRALPGVEELPIDEMWVGFRPGSRDDAPMLGPSGIAGLVHATGHYRNGILLTPATAELVAQYLLSGEVDAAMAPFAPTRFASKVQA
ncbi:MAG: glycine oxidase ThiO [Alphaproteobacteria bacterium]|nr:glycine oxidase ThiO [Alphaproteobacteria bacterium]